MRVLVISIFLFLSHFSSAQDYKLDSLFQIFVDDIEHLQSHNNGVFIWDDDTRLNYYLLMSLSPIDTLVRYLENSNPEIKCSIFHGLINKDAPEELVREILTEYSDDMAKFRRQSTDVITTWTVGEYFQMALERRDLNEIDYYERISSIHKTPSIKLIGERHGRMKKADLLRIDSLHVDKLNFKVTSFSMAFNLSSNVQQLSSESNLLTLDMKNAMKELRSGDTVYFDDVKAITPDSSQITMITVTLQVE